MTEQINIELMGDAELGILLGQQYEMLIQSKNNIQAITNELKRAERQQEKEEPQ
jgi:hypothetical protein